MILFLYALLAYSVFFSACADRILQPTEPSAPTQPSEPLTTTQLQAPAVLSQAELQAIEDFLNDVENNGFIGINCYNLPSEIQLLWVFYNGAGIQLEKDQSQFYP